MTILYDDVCRGRGSIGGSGNGNGNDDNYNSCNNSNMNHTNIIIRFKKQQ